jgi:hypothetical protein
MGACGFRLGLLFPCVADRPREVDGLSVRSFSAGCSSCSSRVLERFVLIHFVSCFWPGGVLRTVRLKVADRSCGTSCSRTVRGQGMNCPFSGCGSGGSVSIFGLSAPDSRTVRRSHTDRPLGHYRLSAWDFADRLSPLLPELRFRVALNWGLFLGLVGPL